MTFIEMMLLIDERKEKIVIDRIDSVHTDAHLYARSTQGIWEEKDLPPPIDKTIDKPLEIIMPPKEDK
jgi:hypothetical protein